MTHDTKTSHHIISDGHNTAKFSHETTQNGHHIVKKTNQTVQADGTHTIHHEKHTLQPDGKYTIHNEKHTMQKDGTHTIHHEKHTLQPDGQYTKHTIQNGNSNTQHGNSTINNANSTIQHGNRTIQYGNTINNANRSTYSEYETMHNGNRSTYNEDDTLHYEDHQNQDQIQEPSESMSTEFELKPQPKWGGPQKQSANVPTGKLRLDAAVTFLKVGFIKTRKRFSGNESSSAIFEMFIWSVKNRDKGFFKRLFDYTDWKLLDINEPRMYTTYETSIVASVVLQKFVYAMNLLLETSEDTRLSTESIKRLEKMKEMLG